MARLLVKVFPSDSWNFSKEFEVDSIPKDGEGVCFGNYSGPFTVDFVVHDLVKKRVEIEINCDGDFHTVATLFMEISGWKISHEKGFRRDEAEIRKEILAQYDKDDFVPEFGIDGEED
ncbi:MAG: hypothetical protein PHP62_05475 [Candidatus Moranbacteria bacterium]|nr:hypothetical protein [Candidatus Moranbacteria bacterium]